MHQIKISENRYLSEGVTAYVVNNLQEAKDFIKDYDSIAMDFETTGLDYEAKDFDFIGVSFAISPFSCIWVPADMEGSYTKQDFMALVKEVFETKEVIIFNAQYEIAIAMHNFNVPNPRYKDVMIYAFLSDSNLKETGEFMGRQSETGKGLSLKSLASSEKWEVVKYTQVNGLFELESDIEYAVLDSLYTYYFYEKFRVHPHVIAQNSILKLEHDVMTISIKAMLKRFAVDLEYTNKLLSLAKEERALLLTQMQKIAEDEHFNPDSPQQVNHLLFTKMCFPTGGLEKGANEIKTDDFNLSCLEKMPDAFPIANRIRRYRGMGNIVKVCEGLLSSSIKKEDNCSSIKLKLNPIAAATGRFSCGGGNKNKKKADGYAKINAQAIAKPTKIEITGCELSRDESSEKLSLALFNPYVSVYLRDEKVYCTGCNNDDICVNCQFNSKKKEHKIYMVYPIQDCLIARPGYVLLDNDYSAIEMRIAAALSKEPFWVNAINNNMDLHTETAVNVFGESARGDKVKRSLVKAINFGALYGSTASSFCKSAGISYQAAVEIFEKWWNNVPALKNWTINVVSQAQQIGYIKTAYGRIRNIPWLKSGDRKEYAKGCRISVNSVIQGTGADILKLALVRLNRYLEKTPDLDMRFLLSIHDAIICEVRIDQAERGQRLLSAAMDINENLKWNVPIAFSRGGGFRVGSILEDWDEFISNLSTISEPVKEANVEPVKQKIYTSDRNTLKVYPDNTEVFYNPLTGSYTIALPNAGITKNYTEWISIIIAHAKENNKKDVKILYSLDNLNHKVAEFEL